MRSILKGFLEPKAETYVLPAAADIHIDGKEEFIPLVEEEEAPAPPSRSPLSGMPSSRPN